MPFRTADCILPLLASVAACVPMEAAHAARPLITDDARIVDAKACQVETWVKEMREIREHWVLPACNFSGNLEIAFGGVRERSDAGSATGDVQFQMKTLFKTLGRDGWGIGLALGNVRHAEAGGGVIGDVYAYVPASFSFRNDRTVLHTNLGWLREKERPRHRLTWGVGAETQLAGRTWLILEGFGNDLGSPLYQFGVRQWLVPDRLQVDVTYGNKAGGNDERWFSVGLRILTPPFLP